MNAVPAIKTGLYRHFKGNYYHVLGIAKHSETEEVMVIYAPDDNREDLWIRPLSMFTETVDAETGETQRFLFVGEQK